MNNTSTPLNDRYWKDEFYQTLATARGWSSGQVIAAARRRQNAAIRQGADPDDVAKLRLDNPYSSQDAWQYLVNCSVGARSNWAQGRRIRKTARCESCGQMIRRGA